MVDAVRIGVAAAHGESCPTPDVLTSDVVSGLERLARLRQTGALIEEEFTPAKAELLAGR